MVVFVFFTNYSIVIMLLVCVWLSDTYGLIRIVSNLFLYFLDYPPRFNEHTIDNPEYFDTLDPAVDTRQPSSHQPYIQADKTSPFPATAPQDPAYSRENSREPSSKENKPERQLSNQHEPHVRGQMYNINSDSSDPEYYNEYDKLNQYNRPHRGNPNRRTDDLPALTIADTRAEQTTV